MGLTVPVSRLKALGSPAAQHSASSAMNGKRYIQGSTLPPTVLAVTRQLNDGVTVGLQLLHTVEAV